MIKDEDKRSVPRPGRARPFQNVGADLVSAFPLRLNTNTRLWYRRAVVGRHKVDPYVSALHLCALSAAARRALFTKTPTIFLR